MPTLTEIENALDHGQLWVAINNGRYWVARRNGATKRWKKDAQRFYVPFKYGLRGYGSLTETDIDNFGAAWPAFYVISATQPGAGEPKPRVARQLPR